MKLRWSVGVIAVLALAIVSNVCCAQTPNALDKPGTKAGDTATGPDGGVCVWVPAGEFDMGSKEGDGDEQPVHHVRITKGFWLGKCTVAFGQWKAYCEKVGIKMEASGLGDNHPVVNVTWGEAVAYCEHYRMSLPTEAQWEYAARGPDDRRYPWGEEWDPKKCCNNANQGPRGQTFPVGSFPEGVSWCGALDMAGNVWQWCKDWYASTYYAASPDADPQGPGEGEHLTVQLQSGNLTFVSRALRGGSWFRDGRGCRSSFRTYNYFDAPLRNFVYGLRACKTP
jgi:formylglycine-generating enzyme required for sulfatase activity